jgi:hypothetical protein
MAELTEDAKTSRKRGGSLSTPQDNMQGKAVNTSGNAIFKISSHRKTPKQARESPATINQNTAERDSSTTS